MGVCALTTLLVVLETANIGVASKLRFGAPGFRTNPNLNTIFNRADIGGAIRLGIGALTVWFTILKRPDIGATGQGRVSPPGFRTLARPYTLLKVSGICAAIGFGIRALTVKQVIPERTNVCVAINIAIAALTVLRIFSEFTNIFIAIGIDIGALTALLIVLELSDIFVAVGISIRPLTVSLVILETADILTAICKGIRALTALLVIAPGSDVGAVATRKRQNPLTVPLAVFERPNILVAVGITIGTLPMKHPTDKVPNILLRGRNQR